jgi:hypothetical protein
MSPDRAAQSPHPVSSLGNLSRKSQHVQHRDHRPVTRPGALGESWATAIPRLALFFVRFLQEGCPLVRTYRSSWGGVGRYPRAARALGRGGETLARHSESWGKL